VRFTGSPVVREPPPGLLSEQRIERSRSEPASPPTGEALHELVVPILGHQVGR
jgi:hypothetical protein